MAGVLEVTTNVSPIIHDVGERVKGFAARVGCRGYEYCDTMVVLPRRWEIELHLVLIGEIRSGIWENDLLRIERNGLNFDVQMLRNETYFWNCVGNGNNGIFWCSVRTAYIL